nr:MAG: hypothetical protein [Crogonang virus 166]
MRLRSGKRYSMPPVQGRKKRRRTTVNLTVAPKKSARKNSKLSRKIRSIVNEDKELKMFPDTKIMTSANTLFVNEFGIGGPAAGVSQTERSSKKLRLQGVRVEVAAEHGSPQNVRSEEIHMHMYLVSTNENADLASMWFRNDNYTARRSFGEQVTAGGTFAEKYLPLQKINTDEVTVHAHWSWKCVPRNLQQGRSGHMIIAKKYKKIGKIVNIIENAGVQLPGTAGVNPRFAIACYYTIPARVLGPEPAPPPAVPIYDPSPDFPNHIRIKWYFKDM